MRKNLARLVFVAVLVAIVGMLLVSAAAFAAGPAGPAGPQAQNGCTFGVGLGHHDPTDPLHEQFGPCRPN